MKKTIAFIGMTVLLAVFSTVGAAQITAEDSTAATNLTGRYSVH